MKKVLFLGTLLALLATTSPLAVNATEIKIGEQPILSSQINEDSYLFGGNVNSSAKIFGDLVTGGGNVLITESISQDLTIAGGSVTVTSSIGDDLRVAGGNITITGAIGGDLVIAGGQAQVSSPQIGGDVVWVGGALTINSPVRGNLTLAGGEVFINAPVSGNITFRGEKISLGEGARISGDLSYKTPKEAEIAEGAVVSGEIIHELSKKTVIKNKKISAGFLIAIFSIATLIGFLMKLVGALVFGLLFKKYSTTLIENAITNPWKEVGRGFLTLVAMPIASILLLVTVIGAPLGVIGLLGFAVLMIFACLLSPVLLGTLMHRWVKKSDTYTVNWKTILAGVVVYMILGLIPIIGWIAKLILVLLVLGGSTKIKMKVANEWR